MCGSLYKEPSTETESCVNCTKGLDMNKSHNGCLVHQGSRNFKSFRAVNTGLCVYTALILHRVNLTFTYDLLKFGTDPENFNAYLTNSKYRKGEYQSAYLKKVIRLMKKMGCIWISWVHVMEAFDGA